ncbi:MAG: 4Fe-4S binding protein [Deltaproteobacteria bacterium]|nr:4Fe-4S binding protein [Candidatus Zymogenaceae bacterium]
METYTQESFVETIGDRCRVCYTCVRECPAKAIRISGGQAEILPERCISCGHCVSVCSQGAKRVISSLDSFHQLLDSNEIKIACIAPSAPAEFSDIGIEHFIGMVRALGFDKVCEVAFGADLVSDRYRRLIEEGKEKEYISTTCPALIGFVERYHPGIAASLAPIVSPMIAVARALRMFHGQDIQIAFIGPCVAKKKEAVSRVLNGEVNVVITFNEMREIFDMHNLTPDSCEPSDFDPPRSGLGMLFPITRGLFQAADIRDDILENRFVATGGSDFVEVIKEYEEGIIQTKILEVLCCDGCIMGPGMSVKTYKHERQSLISQYARKKLAEHNREEWQEVMRQCQDLDLSRTFEPQDDTETQPICEAKIEKVLADLGKYTPQDELNCGACGYETCRDHAIAIIMGLAENEMCLPHTIDMLKNAYETLHYSHEQLAQTRAALEQAEKMASLGKLAAGIAHEINNPLGIVLMYAHTLLEEVSDEALNEDLTMIAQQADRCKRIVSDLLQFARKNRVELQSQNLYSLVERTINQMNISSGIGIELECTCDNPVAEVDTTQIIQVITNIVDNAVHAMSGHGKLNIRVDGTDDEVFIAITDSGIGIAQEYLKKIFEPFYTTKQMGKGTGLGLAVSYGIIKMHRGGIDVQSNTDPDAGPTGTTFTIRLPRNSQLENDEHP